MDKKNGPSNLGTPIGKIVLIKKKKKGIETEREGFSFLCIFAVRGSEVRSISFTDMGRHVNKEKLLVQSISRNKERWN